MPVFLNAGNVTAAHQMNFGALSQNTLNFLNGQLNMIQNSPQFSGMYEAAKMQFEIINGDHAMRIADSVMNASNTVFDANAIVQVLTLEQLQLANPYMQRWIMADTYLREQAMAGRIHGYRDTVVDNSPGLVGEECVDWQLMHQGLIYEVEGRDWEMKNYYAEFAENERPLSVLNRMDIYDAQQFAKEFIKARQDDPTSPYGDLL